MMAEIFGLTWQFIISDLYISLFVFFIFGACIGSFLNAVIYRIPNNIDLIFRPSHCPSCKNKLRFFHNVPLFSWLLLKGKCAFCQLKISSRYFYIELFTALVFSLSGYLLLISNFSFIAIIKFASLITLLIPLFFIDLEYKALPNKITYIGLILGIIFCLFPSSNLITASISYHLISGIYSFLLIYIIIKIGKATITKDVMGYGDAKLMAIIGLFLGLWFSLFILLIASLIALSFYFIKKQRIIPFGSYLSFTAIFYYLSYLIIK